MLYCKGLKQRREEAQSRFWKEHLGKGGGWAEPRGKGAPGGRWGPGARPGAGEHLGAGGLQMGRWGCTGSGKEHKPP